MPDMWLDVDTALSEVPVNIAPLIDDTDFKTRETAIAYNAAGMDLVWNFITSAGAFTQTAVTPTTAGVYDWNNQGDGMYTIEIPASGGGSINNDTEGYGWFTGLVTGVLPWRGPVIGFRASGLNDLLCDSAYSATRGLSGTALPAAAADAAGGIPISDAGGLDMDAISSELAKVPKSDGSASWNATALASINTEVDTALSDINLHYLMKNALATGWGTEVVADSALDYMADNGTAVYDRTTDSLQALRDRGDAAYLTATGFSTHSAADVRTEMDSNSTQFAQIITDISNLNDLSSADVTTALNTYDSPTYDELLAFIQLIARSDSAIAADRSTALSAINANEGTGAGSFDNTTDSEEGIRNNTAWNTATGFSTHSAADVRSEIDANSTQLAAIIEDTETTIPGVLGTPSVDIATDLLARTPTAAQLAYIVANAALGVPITFSGTGTTTSGTIATYDGGSISSNDDQYKSRLLVFDGTLEGVVTDITGYTGSTGAFTCTAVPLAITSSHTARMI